MLNDNFILHLTMQQMYVAKELITHGNTCLLVRPPLLVLVLVKEDS